MNIWICSMECAGLIEAGGVKDVTCALSETFSSKGHNVTLFLPRLGCLMEENLSSLQENVKTSVLSLCEQKISVTYSTATYRNFKVVLVNHQAFTEKKAVYVYTKEEEAQDPRHVQGTGHTDTHFLDSLLCKAIASWGESLPHKEIPHIVHCQDASTALTPAFIFYSNNSELLNTKCVVTIHNAGPAYHHEFQDIWEACYYTELNWGLLTDSSNEGRIEPFLIASHYAYLTTVSTYYAEELMDPNNNKETDGLSSIFAERNINILGITNGIDYSRYKPEDINISLLPYDFSPKDANLEGKYKNRDYFLNFCHKDSSLDSPYLKNFERYGYLENGEGCYFVYHGRIVHQKGIKVLIEAIYEILKEPHKCYFIIVGQGDRLIEQELKDLASDGKGRVVYFKGYNHALPRLSVCAGDFAILPSNFEPCCLEDFICQIYGTLPIAHATGGLKKIVDGETGFLYSPNTKENLKSIIEKAYNLCTTDPYTMSMYIKWASNFVQDIYSWDYVVEDKYLKFFQKITETK